MRKPEKTLIWATLFFAVTTAASPAKAQEEEAPPPALQYYQNAQDLYDQGRYEEAAEELERASALDPGAPELLYNLALIYERLNNYDRAIERLQTYSVFDMEDDERERVERMMARLEGARQHMPEPDTPEPSTRVVVRRRGLADGWFWSMVAVTAAFTAGAIGTGTMALVYGQEAETFVVGENNRVQYDWLVDTSWALALSADVLIGAAGAAALTALLLHVLRERPAEEVPPQDEDDGWMENDVESFSMRGTTPSPMPAVTPLVGSDLGGVMIAWEL